MERHESENHGTERETAPGSDHGHHFVQCFHRDSVKGSSGLCVVKIINMNIPLDHSVLHVLALGNHQSHQASEVKCEDLC